MLNEKKAHKEEEQARMYAFMGDLYESKFKKFNNIRDHRQIRRDSFRNSFGSPQRNLHLQSPNRSRYRQSPNQSRASLMSPLRYSPRPLANSTPTRRRMSPSPSATVTSPVENMEQSETPASEQAPAKSAVEPQNVEPEIAENHNVDDVATKQPKDYVLPLGPSENNLVPDYSDEECA